VAPEWLRGVAPPDWHERYDRRVENIRLPEAAAKREAYAVQVGADGYLLLDALDRSGTPEDLSALPAVAVLRRVWARHYERIAPDTGGKGRDRALGVRLRALQARDPDDRVESPYDPDARYRTRSGRTWVGYVVHLTETCDEDAPRLVVHADTTDASVHEAMRVAPIHSALAAKGLAPAQHRADAAYMGADLLLDVRERHGIDLIGPQRRDMSWQGTVSDAFNIADSRWTGTGRWRAARRGRRASPGPATATASGRTGARSCRCASTPTIAGPVRRGLAARAQHRRGAAT
jgi:hypothetical protein